jgi:hypothetical protein
MPEDGTRKTSLIRLDLAQQGALIFRTIIMGISCMKWLPYRLAAKSFWALLKNGQVLGQGLQLTLR